MATWRGGLHIGDNMEELETVKLARSHLEEDHGLALFMVRDLQVVKALELSDLAWAMHKNYCVRSEVKWLLDELEAHLTDTGTD